jgi:hypothetical protein
MASEDEVFVALLFGWQQNVSGDVSFSFAAAGMAC